MQFKHLLPKSSKTPDNPKPEETLVGHTEAVVEAAMVLNDVLVKEIMNILGAEFDEGLWRDALLCSAWLHDLGKANDHFQKMIRNASFRQGVRHETLGLMSYTSGTAGGLKYVNRSKRLKTKGHLKGGGYLPNINLAVRVFDLLFLVL